MNWYKKAQLNVDKEWIDALDDLQKSKNNGRGVSCVKTFIDYLKMGMTKEALAVYNNESDKIMSYPDIYKMIKNKFGIKDVFDTILKGQYVQKKQYKMNDGIFSFWTAHYGSWAKDVRVVFRVRNDSNPEQRAQEKKIEYYDHLSPSTDGEIEQWLENHMDYKIIS